MKRELGAAGVPPSSSDSRRSVQEQQEISRAVKAGWHRQMAEGQRNDSSGRGTNGSGSGGG